MVPEAREPEGSTLLGVASDLFGDLPAGPVAHGHPRAPMVASLPIHDRVGHDDSGQRHPCLCQINRVARPKQGRSTSSTTGRSFTRAIRHTLHAQPHPSYRPASVTIRTCSPVRESRGDGVRMISAGGISHPALVGDPCCGHVTA